MNSRKRKASHRSESTEDLQVTITNLRALVAVLQDQKKAADTARLKGNLANRELLDTCDNLDARLAQLSAEHETALSEVNAVCQEAQRMNVELKRTVTGLQAEHAAYTLQLKAEHEKALTDANAESQKAQRKNEEFERSITKLKTEHAKKIEEYGQELGEREKRIFGLEAEHYAKKMFLTGWDEEVANYTGALPSGVPLEPSQVVPSTSPTPILSLSPLPSMRMAPNGFPFFKSGDSLEIKTPSVDGVDEFGLQKRGTYFVG